jgi:hypothetical protein
MHLILFGIIGVVSTGVLVHQFFVAPRLWMKHHGNGKEVRDRRGYHFFSRQYKDYQRLEALGENPKGRHLN